MLEGERRQALGDDRPGAVDDVARAADAVRHGRRRDHPPGSQAREAVRLGQAARRDEHVAARRRRRRRDRRSRPCRPRRRPRARRRVPRSVRSPRARPGRPGTPVGLCGEVMTIDFRPRRHRVAHAIGIQREAVVERAIEPDRARAEHPRRAQQRVVARTLDEHLVPRLEQRGEHQEVRARRAARRRHAIRIDAVARANRLDQRPVAVVVRAPRDRSPRARPADRRASTPGCCCPRDRTPRRRASSPIPYRARDI